ncbi:MAG: tetracycline resistance MFS efflux pump, partial [Alphaproteobacteria bacterium]
FNILVQVFLTGPAVRRFGERGIVLIGLSVGFLGMMTYALAENGFLFLLGAPLAALFGFVNSGIQGLMTRRVQPSEQGQLQGANSSFQGITATVAPQIFSNVFAWSILRGGAVGWHGLPGLILWGAPILLAAAFTLAALLLALRVAKPVAPSH